MRKRNGKKRKKFYGIDENFLLTLCEHNHTQNIENQNENKLLKTESNIIITPWNV